MIRLEEVDFNYIYNLTKGEVFYLDTCSTINKNILLDSSEKEDYGEVNPTTCIHFTNIKYGDQIYCISKMYVNNRKFFIMIFNNKRDIIRNNIFEFGEIYD